MDVKIAFLNKNLEEEVYMDQHEEFYVKGKEYMIFKLKKSIYGLNKLPDNGILSLLILLLALILRKYY